MPSSSTCRNCGEALRGPFCSSCGQEDVDLRRPLKALAEDAVGDLLNLDTRLLRTLGPLFCRPGHLAREYLAGRRVRYVPPLKMFLLASVVFFGLVALLPKAHLSVTHAGQPVPEGRGLRLNIQLPKPEDARAWFGPRIAAAAERAQQHPAEFWDVILANLPRAFFVLLPVFALLLKLFYRRQDAFYLDHLIFALYYHAFAFGAWTLLLVLKRPWVPGLLSTFGGSLVALWLFLYLPIGLRKVYGGSRWKTLFKLAGLLVTYFVAFLGTIFLLVLVALWEF